MKRMRKRFRDILIVFPLVFSLACLPLGVPAEGTGESAASAETLDDGVIRGTQVMTHTYYEVPIGLGYCGGVPDGEGGLSSVNVDRLLLSWKYGVCYFRSNTLVNWDYDEEDYATDSGRRMYPNGLYLPPEQMLDQGDLEQGFGQELIDWGQANGYDWNDDTVIQNVTATTRGEILFLDENGDPANFLSIRDDEGIGTTITQPNVYLWPTATEDGTFSVTEPLTVSYDSSHVSVEQAVELVQTGDEVHLGKIPLVSEVFTQSSYGWHYRTDYLGTLQVVPQIEWVFSFEADGQEFEITLVTRDCSQVYEVVRGETTHQSENPDSDLSAVVKHDGTSSALDTENDAVTLVQHGDEITYQIDLSTQAETEVFYQYYEALCKMSATGYLSEEALEDLDEGITDYYFSDSVNEYWTYAGEWDDAEEDKMPRLTVDFHLPQHLDYSEDQTSAITLSQEKTDSPRWTIYESATSVTYETDGSTDLHLELILSDPDSLYGAGITAAGAAANLNLLQGDTLTLQIPGVTVSDEAQYNTLYTAKATVSGHLHMDYESIEHIPAPELASLSADTSGDAADVQSSTALVSIPSAAALSQLTAAPAAESVAASKVYTADDFTTSVAMDQFDMRDFVPSLDYQWTHQQDAEGKDVIQEETASDELWYTVELSHLTITKQVTGETASDADRQTDFAFRLNVDPSLGSTSYQGELVTAADDGSFTTEAVSAYIDENGQYTFTLKDQQSLSLELPAGTAYTVTELDVSDAYEVSEDGGEAVLQDTAVSDGLSSYTYSGTVDGSVNSWDESDTVRIVNHKKPLVTICKQDEEGNLLAGASLRLTDDQGQTVQEWTTGSEAEEIYLSEGTYTLSETAAPAGYETADDVVFTVTDTADPQVITMEDVYVPSGELTLTAKKVLEGRTLQAGEFSFTLKDESGNVLATAENAADGTITFGTLTYGKEDIGTHSYTITETSDPQDLQTVYDTSVYTVTVEVSDAGAGRLEADAAYSRDGQAVSGAVFTNRSVTGSPKTGDESDGTHWWALLAASSLLMLATALGRSRSRERSHRRPDEKQ